MLEERNAQISDLQAQILGSRKEVSGLQKEHEAYSSAKAAEVDLNHTLPVLMKFKLSYSV